MKKPAWSGDICDTRDTRQDSEHAALVHMLRNMPPEQLRFYPPDVLAEAEKSADPLGYLHTWLTLKKKEAEGRVFRGKFILECRRHLLEAGFTPKQLEGAAESGEGFERIMRAAYTQAMIPPRFRAAANRLKRFHQAWRFPLDVCALADAARAVTKAAKSLPQKSTGGTAEFLPSTEGKITLFRNPGKLSEAERETIEASRDAALEKVFTLSPGARDQATEFGVLRDIYSLPADFRSNAFKPFEPVIRTAATTGDLDFFVRLGECLKKAKAESKKADAAFMKRFEDHRLALFLIENWLPSPRLRGTWLHDYLSNPDHFANAGIHFSPRWLSSGALLATLGGRQAAKRHKALGLCVFTDAALVKVCKEILGTSFKKNTVNMTIRRVGLKRCPNQDLSFTQVEKHGDKLLAYRSSSNQTS